MERLEQDASILFPGADAAIRRAAALVPLAIASGALGAEIRRVLDREELTPCFTAIVAAEDTPVSKPAPDPYLRAVALLAEALGGPLRAVGVRRHRGLAVGTAVGAGRGPAHGRASPTRTTGPRSRPMPVISSLDELDVASGFDRLADGSGLHCCAAIALSC